MTQTIAPSAKSPPDHLDQPGTPVGRLIRRWLVDSGPVASGENELETAERADRLTDGLASSARLPAITWADADAKLLVLSARLIQTATTGDPKTMLVILLAVGIRHDLRRLRLV